MKHSAEETRLTDEGFWEDFWDYLKVPDRVTPRSSMDRSMSRAFLNLVPSGQGKKLIEIGAAPGRWLVFFHEKLGYAVDGIEYVPSACRKTEENLAACETEGNVFQQDFFHNDLPKHSYDVVLSLGFIEHFTDLAPVVTGHTALLKPGGLLLLGVPNLRGINYLMGRLINPDNLAAHNLETMSVLFMQKLSQDYDLAPLWIGYVGGPHPGIFAGADDAAGKTGGFAKKLRRSLFRFVVLRLLNGIRNRIPFLDHLNGSLISGYLLAVYRYAPQEKGGVAADPE
jgi:SAM-dependent methyltransferase